MRDMVEEALRLSPGWSTLGGFLLDFADTILTGSDCFFAEDKCLTQKSLNGRINLESSAQSPQLSTDCSGSGVWDRVSTPPSTYYPTISCN